MKPQKSADRHGKSRCRPDRDRYPVFRSDRRRPVIQEASQRALAAGCTTDKLFDMVKEARQRVKIPMVFMTYINPVYTYGKERFMKRCVECGIDGIIVPDLPYEEKEELSGVCESYGID